MDISTANPKYCDPPKTRGQSAPIPVKKVEKKKRKKNGKRKQGGGTGPPRQLNPATVIDHKLRKEHPVKTLTIGSAAANMKRCGLTDHEAKLMQEQLKIGTDLANQLQLRAYYACAVMITHLLDKHSQASSSTAAETDLPGQMRTIFNHILDSQTFMFALGRLLFHGKFKAQKDSTWNLGDPGNPTPQESAQMAYTLFQEKTGLRPLKDNPTMSQIAILRLSEMAMVSVQAAIRSHYRNCDVSYTFNGAL
jgi:hypothetical protein